MSLLNRAVHFFPDANGNGLAKDRPILFSALPWSDALKVLADWIKSLPPAK